MLWLFKFLFLCFKFNFFIDEAIYVFIRPAISKHLLQGFIVWECLKNRKGRITGNIFFKNSILEGITLIEKL